MQITLYTTATAFDALAAEWQDLMGRAVSAPIFMTVEYQKTWWDNLGSGELRLLAIREPDSKTLVGLAPLFIDNKQLNFVGCVDVSDYLDFLVDNRYQDAVYQTIIKYLATEMAHEWETAYLCSLPHHSPTREAFLTQAKTFGWQATAEVEEVCPVITLSDSWDDYLAGIDKKQRHEIRRKLRKAENTAQTNWYVIETAEQLNDSAIDKFVDLHRKSTPDKDEFWDEKKLRFFYALIHQAAEKGWLKLYFVDIDGETASALLCFDYRNEILVYNSGFDMEKFAHLSPGNIIVSYSIQHAIELGRQRYDFLRGDEIYKFRFGAKAENVYALNISKEGN